jgi:hypothetical protein
MIVNAAVFTCSICGEPSTNICAYCTKDACANHRCERCKRCSDCCECDVPLSAEEAVPDPVAEAHAEVFLDPLPPAEPSVFAEPLDTTDPDESPYLSDQDDAHDPADPDDPTEPL